MTMLDDVRFALRGFRRNPGFTAVVIVVLGLGIGANTAIFSVVDALVLRPLPFPEADRLVTIHTRGLETGRIGMVSWPDMEDVRGQVRSLEHPVVYRPRQMVLTERGESETVNAVIASAELFAVLGVPPALGRGFLVGEDVPGRPRVAVVSQGLWRRRLGGDLGALGRTINVDGEAVTVVGVAAPGFRFPLDDRTAELWLPLDRWIDKTARQWRSMITYRSAIARLRPGATLAGAQAELNALRAGQARTYPKDDGGSVLLVRSFHDEWVAGDRTNLLVLLGAVAVLLLIACANVASLQLARAVARRQELAIRAALGAGCRRLARQLVTESALLVLASAALGLVAAWSSLDLLAAAVPDELSRPHAIALDRRVLGYTLAVAAACTLLIGAAPVLVALRSQGGVLVRSERGTAGGHARMLTGLVLGEIALAVILVVGAGLLLRTFARVSGIDPGFQPRSLLTARIKLGATQAKGDLLYRRLNEGLAKLPGVQGFALGSPLPFVGWFGGSMDFRLSDRPPPRPEAPWRMLWHSVGPSYFSTLGIPVVRGRGFDESDTPATPRVAVINESFARRFFPDSDPLGRHVLAYTQFDWRIVGVVADTRGTTCPSSGCRTFADVTLEQPPDPALYSSLGQSCCGSFEVDVLVRHPAPASMVGPLRALVRDIDPNLAVHEVRTMEEAIGGSLAQRRLNTWLLSVWAGLALVLAALGIHGVLSYAVARRTRELAIRSALGAQARQLRGMVVGQGLRVAAVGLVVGTAGALGVTRVLASQLYGVSPTDPPTFLGLVSLVLAVAALASYLPARRATRVDPMIALRQE
jgi:putative ABC transport system permease protein